MYIDKESWPSCDENTLAKSSAPILATPSES